MNKTEIAIFRSGVFIGVISTLMAEIIFVLFLLLFAGCNSGDTTLPKYTGQTPKMVYTINQNTMRLISAPKDLKAQPRFTALDSVYVSPEESFVIALKGGKPICTVFPNQDSASLKPPQ